MSIKIAPERMRVIEASGYGISGDIGGLQRTTYYTPAGRIIKTFPSMRERTIKNSEGQVTFHGMVDANLDRGWLLHPPQVLKPYCRGCDGWHDTQEEVDKCIITQETKLAAMEKQAKNEIAKESLDKDLKIADLERKVDKLTSLMEKFIETGGKDIGEILQRSSDETALNTVKPDKGRRLVRVSKKAVQ